MTWYGQAWRCRVDRPFLQGVKEMTGATIATDNDIDIYDYGGWDGHVFVSVNIEHYPSDRLDYNTIVKIIGNSQQSMDEQRKNLEVLLGMTLTEGTEEQKRHVTEFAEETQDEFRRIQLDHLLTPGKHHE
jgi:hypothetical protein